MRDIGKFRGKTNEGEWVSGSYFNGDLAWIIQLPFKFIVVIPETVSEPTGIKDENGHGQDVYENNFIKRKGDDTVYVVAWRKVYGQWWLREYVDKTPTKWAVPLMTAAAQERITVIGSIHEEAPCQP